MDFFVKCKRKLDFCEEMIYAYKQAEQMQKNSFFRPDREREKLGRMEDRVQV